VCLDPGHGGQDPGAVFKLLREKDITLAVVLKTEAFLKRNGIRVILTRYTDTTVSLADRVGLSNAQPVDCFVSVHCNADADPDAQGLPEATGSEVWYFTRSKNGKALAKLLGEGLKHSFEPLGFRGLKPSEGLYVLKHTKAPATLVELGFIDSRHDSSYLSSPGVQTRLAQILSSAIQVFLAAKPA
jgi:N-acetylmuramoyl-L-alanine amidase